MATCVAIIWHAHRTSRVFRRTWGGFRCPGKAEGSISVGAALRGSGRMDLAVRDGEGLGVDGAVARRIAMALFMSRPLGALAQAADGPRPPCGVMPQPSYAPLGAIPAIRTWHAAGWTASACTGWASSRPTLLVALAGSFHHEGGAADFIRCLKRFVAREIFGYLCRVPKPTRAEQISA